MELSHNNFQEAQAVISYMHASELIRNVEVTFLAAADAITYTVVVLKVAGNDAALELLYSDPTTFGLKAHQTEHGLNGGFNLQE